MSRSPQLFLRDILTAAQRVAVYRNEVDWENPGGTEMAMDAILHNLLVLGEAAKQVPEEIRVQAPEVEWRKMAGLRDVLAHGYFRVDVAIIHDVAHNRVDDVAECMERLLGELVAASERS